MTDQITAILTPWTALFEDIKKQIQSFGDAFDQLERETTEIQSAMETVRGELCKDVRACASDTMTRFYNKGTVPSLHPVRTPLTESSIRKHFV